MPEPEVALGPSHRGGTPLPPWWGTGTEPVAVIPEPQPRAEVRPVLLAVNGEGVRIAPPVAPAVPRRRALPPIRPVDAR